MSTENGLASLDPATHRFSSYDVSDGLQSAEFKDHAFCRGSSGAFYFGGINGFNEFFPGNIKETGFDPPLVITALQVYNRNVPVTRDSTHPTPLSAVISETDSIVLPYSSQVISFEFASLNYTAPEKKQYAYFLEGFDKSWNEVGTELPARSRKNNPHGRQPPTVDLKTHTDAHQH